MGFAYIKGQESEALAFFESQLDQCQDPEQKRQLETFVQMLREIIKNSDQADPPSPSKSFSLNHAAA